jgi:hypothetical protein
VKEKAKMAKTAVPPDEPENPSTPSPELWYEEWEHRSGSACTWPKMKIPPEGKSFGGQEDRVTFDQLPEQIRKHYLGGTFKLSPLNAHVFLTETVARLMFDIPDPGKGRDSWADCWEKRNEDWFLVVSGVVG